MSHSNFHEIKNLSILMFYELVPVRISKFVIPNYYSYYGKYFRYFAKVFVWWITKNNKVSWLISFLFFFLLIVRVVSLVDSHIHNNLESNLECKERQKFSKNIRYHWNQRLISTRLYSWYQKKKEFVKINIKCNLNQRLANNWFCYY